MNRREFIKATVGVAVFGLTRRNIQAIPADPFEVYHTRAPEQDLVAAWLPNESFSNSWIEYRKWETGNE